MKTYFEPNLLNLDDSFSNISGITVSTASTVIPKGVIEKVTEEEVIIPFKPKVTPTPPAVTPPSLVISSPPLIVTPASSTPTPTYSEPVSTPSATPLATSSLDSPSYGGGGGGAMPSSESSEGQEAKVGGGAVVATKKILGMKPILFYSLLAVAIGYGYYKYKKSK